jgi:hypothetical protein
LARHVWLGDFPVGADTIFNSVDAVEGELRYAFMIFSPANPVTGSGVVGSFEIVPLLAGTSQIQFISAQVSSIEFNSDAAGQSIGGDAVDIAYLPIMLEAQILGDPATRPLKSNRNGYD